MLERLQTTLLAGAPRIEQLDVAVAYQSALDEVGIGGDWYSVVDLPTMTYLVIGDIAGHGADAVAVMAEVKTIIRHLLTAGTPMEEVMRQADDSLQARHAFASAVLVGVDKRSNDLSYVNAGHPYPLLTRRGVTTALPDTHRPWLSVPHDLTVPTRIDFEVGDRLLLYTEGLVEDRRVSISECIDALAVRLSQSPQASPDELVAGLLAARNAERVTNTTSVDDDIAVIAATRRSIGAD